MATNGIEEIFLKVKNMEAAIDFYHGILGIPLDKQDEERTYLQMDRGHLVLQIELHTGRHQVGGPLHFALSVTEEEFDNIKLVNSVNELLENKEKAKKIAQAGYEFVIENLTWEVLLPKYVKFYEDLVKS